MLSFVQDKLTSLMENAHRMGRAEILTPRIKTYSRHSLQPKRELMNRVSDFVYFNPVLLSGFEERGAQRNRTIADQGTILPQGVQNLLSNWLNFRIPAIQLHQNEMFDNLLRERQADAMTIGNDIYFRSGKFDLRTAGGLGLLGHELTHVAQQNADDWRNPAGINRSEFLESSALENERFVLRNVQALSQRNQLSFASGSLANSGSTSAIPSVPAPPTPMFADAARNVGANTSAVSAESDAVMSERELARIKEEVYRDLMMKIKVEFERGA